MQENGKAQRYTPDWEPVSQAAQRIAAGGLSLEDAKIDLCHAIADGRIYQRATLSKSHRTHVGGIVRSPPHLKPSEIDWQNSRPIGKWSIGPTFSGIDFDDDGYQELDLLEVSTADVIEIFRLTDMSAVCARLNEVEVESLFRDLRRENSRLTQAEAVEIAQMRGAISDRKKNSRNLPTGFGPTETGT